MSRATHTRRLAQPAWLVAAIVAVAALSAGGCSWFGKDEKPPAPLPDFRSVVNASIGWQQPLEAAGAAGFSPIGSGDAVYAATAEGTLASFDAATGRLNWRVKTGGKLSAGVGADGDTIVVGTSKGDVLAFDRTGKPRWTSRVSSEVLGPPRISDSVTVVWSGDGNVFGLTTADGMRRWVLQRTMPALSVRNQAGGIIARGAIFLGVAGGKLLAIDLDKGILGWEGTVAQPKGATELERIADVTSLPAIMAGAVCAAAYQGRVACFDPAKGTFLWSRDIPSKDGLVLDNRHLYVTDDKGAIHALDNATGTSVWKQDKLVTRSPSGPQLLGDYLAVVDYQGYVHILNRNDGSLVGRVATDGTAATAQPVALKDGLLFQTRKGALVNVIVR
jgi:outer membrane protein assembly factor BamB